MNARLLTTTLVIGLLSSLLPADAQDARFFRVVGPVSTRITAVTADGWVTWTNDPTNATFTVQTAKALPDENNWVDWVQVPVSNAVTVHRVFDPDPPADMGFIPAGVFLMGATTNMGHEWINNAEWCWDFWLGDYYSASPSSDPRGPAWGPDRVRRGGTWLHYAPYCRCADRSGSAPSLHWDMACRCVRAAGQ